MANSAPGNGNGVRDDHGRFAPGVSGNPQGRPLGRHAISEALRIELDGLVAGENGEQITRAEAIAQKVVDLALDGDMRAVVFLAERLEGKPGQRITVDARPRRSARDIIADIKRKYKIYDHAKASEASIVSEAAGDAIAAGPQN